MEVEPPRAVRSVLKDGRFETMGRSMGRSCWLPSIQIGRVEQHSVCGLRSEQPRYDIAQLTCISVGQGNQNPNCLTPSRPLLVPPPPASHASASSRQSDRTLTSRARSWPLLPCPHRAMGWWYSGWRRAPPPAPVHNGTLCPSIACEEGASTSHWWVSRWGLATLRWNSCRMSSQRPVSRPPAASSA